MIPHIEPSFDENEYLAVAEYIQSGAWLTEYKHTRKLEQEIADFLNMRYCFMYPNCTLALYAALMAFNIGPGDDVIVPDFTMVASANAIKMTGAKPVFVDIEEKTLCLDVHQVENAITEDTKAILSVDLNGRVPDKRLVLISLKYDIPIIEDAAQGFGSYAHNQPLGTFGSIGCFSFSPHKIITTGQGGCCVTFSRELATRLKRFRNFGRESSGGYDHNHFGINLKFTDLQAVVGLAQLKKIQWRIRRKREIFSRYRQNLSNYVKFLPTDLTQTTPWYVDIFTIYRDRLVEHLMKNGVGTQRFYPAIHSTGAYNEYGHYPISEWATKEGLWLPSSVTLTDTQIDVVSSEIVRFLERIR